jgi:hypothetical protein
MSYELMDHVLFASFFIGSYSIFWGNFLAQKQLDPSKLAALPNQIERNGIRRWPQSEFVLPQAVFWIRWRKVSVAFVIAVCVAFFLMPVH